jgi:hypothetical protein
MKFKYFSVEHKSKVHENPSSDCSSVEAEKDRVGIVCSDYVSLG